MISKDIIKEHIKKYEGFSNIVYKCPAGKDTIGYGFNIDYLTDDEMKSIFRTKEDIIESGISRAEADKILDIKIDKTIQDVYNYIDPVFFETISEARQLVLIDMCYNMGISTFGKFKKMLGAVMLKDWDNAAREMKDSNWYNQVGNRAKDLVELMKKQG